MAKPKQEILVERHLYSITVWTNDPISDLEEISRIEGINSISIICNSNPIYVDVDPRYDISEVADEIEALLTSEVPDIFKE